MQTWMEIQFLLVQKKTNEQIAKEVLEGKWGTKNTNPTRKELLTRAGYDYETIRKLVNAAYEKKN